MSQANEISIMDINPRNQQILGILSAVSVMSGTWGPL